VLRKFRNLIFDWLGKIIPRSRSGFGGRFAIPDGLYDVNCDLIRFYSRGQVRRFRIGDVSILDDAAPEAMNGLKHWRFSSVEKPLISPAAYNYTLENGRVYFPDPAVITHTGKLVTNGTHFFGRQYQDHPIFRLNHLPRLCSLPDARPGIVVSPGSSTYFH
jgi:hypothetical protein